MREFRTNEKGCWIPKNATDNKYQKMWFEDEHRGIHSIMYEVMSGIRVRLGDGFTVDHLCHVKACFNPFHLERVSHSNNTLRARQHTGPVDKCWRGHLYEEGTFYLDKKEVKRCRKCRSITQKAWRQKNA